MLITKKLSGQKPGATAYKAGFTCWAPSAKRKNPGISGIASPLRFLHLQKASVYQLWKLCFMVNRFFCPAMLPCRKSEEAKRIILPILTRLPCKKFSTGGSQTTRARERPKRFGSGHCIIAGTRRPKITSQYTGNGILSKAENFQVASSSGLGGRCFRTITNVRLLRPETHSKHTSADSKLGAVPQHRRANALFVEERPVGRIHIFQIDVGIAHFEQAMMPGDFRVLQRNIRALTPQHYSRFGERMALAL